MKNIFILFVFFSLLQSVKAQDVPAPASAAKDNTYSPSMHIRGGLIFGINAAQIDGDDYAGYHKVGLNFGFYGQIPVSKRFFFSTEILYSQKGAKNPVTPNTPVQYWFTWNIQYAEVPVLIHYQDKRAFNVGAGVSYARMVNEQLSVMGEEPIPTPICTTNKIFNDTVPFCLKKNDFELIAEANYFPIKHLAINVRYQYSPIPIGYYVNSNFINRGMHNNLLSFRLMWIFGS
jgi:hypothetical protein